MKPRGIIAALIEHPTNKNSFLVFNHAKIKKLTMPVGKIDPGYTPEATLKKEMKEELNIDVTSYSFLGKRLISVKNELIDVYVFRVNSYEGEVSNNEPEKHSELRYLYPSEISGNSISKNTEVALSFIYENHSY